MGEFGGGQNSHSIPTGSLFTTRGKIDDFDSDVYMVRHPLNRVSDMRRERHQGPDPRTLRGTKGTGHFCRKHLPAVLKEHPSPHCGTFYRLTAWNLRRTSCQVKKLQAHTPQIAKPDQGFVWWKGGYRNRWRDRSEVCCRLSKPEK